MIDKIELISLPPFTQSGEGGNSDSQEQIQMVVARDLRIANPVTIWPRQPVRGYPEFCRLM